MGSDITPADGKWEITGFNPHSRMGSDLNFLYTSPLQCAVSIHTPAWGVTILALSRSAAAPVSIHTPAWGVTSLAGCGWILLLVSIHTPAWGVTLWTKYPRSGIPRFNPHSRMGSDIISLHTHLNLSVSIHTPAWGVTDCTIFNSGDIFVSIHSPAWGVT